ncbi:MAG: hypothetical protein HXX81_07940 [Campylobacterales bacterium]|nr:hypothetical protein [Campylobacterales bacterium]
MAYIYKNGKVVPVSLDIKLPKKFIKEVDAGSEKQRAWKKRAAETIKNAQVIYDF